MMPVLRKWNRLRATSQWAIVVVGLVLIIGGLVIGLIAKSGASAAGSTAKRTANCVNNVLGTRSVPTANDNRAHIAYALASQQYDDALNAVLVTTPGPAQNAAFQKFLTTAQAKKVADDKYVQTLRADQADRDKTPLGKC